MKRLLAISLLLIVAAAVAQTPLVSKDLSLAGKFYVSVDDHVRIVINGKEVYASPFGESESPEVTLKVGDRLAFNLLNTGGPRRFKAAFLSADRRTLISFTASDLKQYPGFEVMGFTESEYKSFKKVRDGNKRGQALPFKNHSEWVWGETDKCALVTILTRDMFKPAPPP